MAHSRDIERKSSSVTLSDMEIFIFPELLYSLVLANIMSPRIWRWRDDPWFDGLHKMKPYRRITRLKQFIMDHYIFNLDLDTWGLTTKEKEVARFKDFIGPDTLSRSNALFGYEGDKYYFDIDIRTHFGLNKYNDNIIPYWKTETVEAMDAFRHKPNYPSGAGECVSLAALYAAAFFIVAGIPLRDIFLLATPLHSQNFIDVDDGILTNNRRLVTKNMWFNGTELSAQARRALENEQVTVVTHESGYVHTVYEDATIDRGVYARFQSKLGEYLRTQMTPGLLDNFLRHSRGIQKCFQMRWPILGVEHYIPLENVFAYEESCSYTLGDNTRAKLMAEIDSDEFVHEPFKGRIVLNDLEDFVLKNKICLSKPGDQQALMKQFACGCMNAETAINSMIKFCCMKPNLPDETARKFIGGQEPLKIEQGMSRDEIIARLGAIRKTNTMADMAFYAYRDLNRTEAEPFVVAAIERNPVSIAASGEMDEAAVVEKVNSLVSESIYDESGRLAQPDEVWNYSRGDGAEKALLLANILRSKRPGEKMTIEASLDKAVLKTSSKEYIFASSKQLKPQVWNVP
ncbi:MAG: hypothetical protein C0404_02130 [Verrucomicrobia bacterium]|nr:hypothetical protein [Verrucomicrobiota bacterium]